MSSQFNQSWLNHELHTSGGGQSPSTKLEDPLGPPFEGQTDSGSRVIKHFVGYLV